MSHTHCCLCPARISSNKKWNRIGQPKFWKIFVPFVYPRRFDPKLHICPTCHARVRNSRRLGRTTEEMDEVEMESESSAEVSTSGSEASPVHPSALTCDRLNESNNSPFESNTEQNSNSLTNISISQFSQVIAHV